jgi:hypothetical protein
MCSEEDRVESLQHWDTAQNILPLGIHQVNGDFEEIIGTSKVFKRVLHRMQQVHMGSNLYS